jgi:hypothetical protein
MHRRCPPGLQVELKERHMNRTTFVLLFTGLISIGLIVPGFAKRDQPPPSVSIDDVRRAHNLPQDTRVLSAYMVEAVRLRSIYNDTDSELPNFYERATEVAVDGIRFKSHQIDPQEVREETDRFDGQSAYHTEIEEGVVVKANQMGDQQFRDVELNIKTFGLIPILNQISDPATQIVHAGRTARREDKFEVRTATGSWTLYADQRHIIRRLKIGGRTIEYGAYRSVEGIRLPFIQRVYVGGRLKYELAFSRIELNHIFTPGFFNNDTM